MHICKVMEGEHMPRLAGKVEVLDGHLEVLLDAPAMVVHGAQVELSVHPALVCSLLEIVQGLLVVLLHSLSVEMQ